MASTNKTTNYDLSQYVGTDKPTYLGDYNSDMGKIDSAIHNVAESVGTEQGRINVLEGNIGTLSNLQTTDKTSVVNAINEVNTKSTNNTTNIGTLSNLETDNKTTIVNAINEVVEKFNINNFKNNLSCTIETTQGQAPTINTNLQLSSAYNNDGSIGKIYGEIEITGNGPSSSLSYVNITTDDTGLRPTQDITLNGVCNMFTIGNTSDYYRIANYSIILKTNGKILLSQVPIWGGSEKRRFIFTACLIFASDFGDIPVPPQQ